MKVIYVAGPYRAATAWQVEQNIRAAEEVAAIIWALGDVALCPHANSRHMEGVASEEHFLAGTLELLKRCDMVVMVGDWQTSLGASAERKLAEELNMPIISVQDLLHRACECALAGKPPAGSISWSDLSFMEMKLLKTCGILEEVRRAMV